MFTRARKFVRRIAAAFADLGHAEASAETAAAYSSSVDELASAFLDRSFSTSLAAKIETS